MENSQKPITDQAFVHISELKENLQNFSNPDIDVNLEGAKETLSMLRDECRAMEFEEQVDVLEGLESVVVSMINNNMTESAELFELILSGLEHTEKVLQIKGVMKRDLSKSLKATMQDLPTDLSSFIKKEKDETPTPETPEGENEEVIVNFATGRKARRRVAAEENQAEENQAEEAAASENALHSEPEEVVPTEAAAKEEPVEGHAENPLEAKEALVEESVEEAVESKVEEAPAEEPVEETVEAEEAPAEEAGKAVEVEEPDEAESIEAEAEESAEETVEAEDEEASFEEPVEDVAEAEEADREMSAESTEEDSTPEEVTAEADEQEKTVEDEASVIRISDLSIHTIEKTKTAIDQKLKEYNKAQVIAENVSTIDLSYVQLILSIRKSNGESNVSFEFEGELKEEVRLLLNSTGFSAIA